MIDWLSYDGEQDGYIEQQFDAFVRKLSRALCQNRWFDLCNGKDPNGPFEKASPMNGREYADEFLGILAWLIEWENWLRVRV
jgi:hypothetical protein